MGGWLSGFAGRENLLSRFGQEVAQYVGNLWQRRDWLPDAISIGRRDWKFTLSGKFRSRSTKIVFKIISIRKFVPFKQTVDASTRVHRDGSLRRDIQDRSTSRDTVQDPGTLNVAEAATDNFPGWLKVTSDPSPARTGPEPGKRFRCSFCPASSSSRMKAEKASVPN